MAIVKPPLNFFKRITTSVTRESSAAYTVPFDRAGIILNAHTNNNSNQKNYLTLTLSSAELSSTVFLNRFELNSLDVINTIPQKISLQEFDTVFVQGDIPDINTLNDSNAFWEYEIPTTNTTLSGFLVNVQSPASLSADFDNNSLQPITSNQTTSFEVTGINTTGLNMTFSILEAVNLP